MSEEYEARSTKKLNFLLWAILVQAIAVGVAWGSLRQEVKENTKSRLSDKLYTHAMAKEEQAECHEHRARMERDIVAVETRCNHDADEIKAALLRLELKLDKILAER